MEPLVSIIVTTYNRKYLLGAVILSILTQTYDKFELIIVDNYSDYDFFDFLNSFGDSRIKGFQNNNNGVIATNRNFGIDKATGEYIAFCDDDDVWLTEKLKEQIKVFKANSNVNLCCTNRVNIDSDGKVLNEKSLNWIPSKITLQNLLKTNFITLSSVLIKKETLEKVGGFSEDPELFAHEDYHLWIRVALEGELYFLNKKLLQYRVHSANYSKKRSIGIINVKKVYKDIFAKYKFSLLDRIITYLICDSKFVIYKLRGM